MTRQWDLVCERRALYSTTFSVSHLLRTISSLCQGLVIDVFGRGRVAKVCGTLYVLCGVLAACASSLQMYLVLRGIEALLEAHLYVACFVLSLELCTPRQRPAVGNLFAVPYAFGCMALPGLGLLVKDWRYLQLLTTTVWRLLEKRGQDRNVAKRLDDYQADECVYAFRCPVGGA
ncbi:hypothetical protein O3P69_004693 [Scylla paramamosain]|uniref:Major facilitator superfamily (MFS) profile domain-containing protein n=1 Tax=Scylla paramamosain TaxID=85552 RepID=A0AAW0UD48_SCYPA